MDIYNLIPISKRGLEFSFVSLSVKLAPNAVKNIWEGYEIMQVEYVDVYSNTGGQRQDLLCSREVIPEDTDEIFYAVDVLQSSHLLCLVECSYLNEET
jgi:hypothetical protein